MKKLINKYLIVAVAAFAFACDSEDTVDFNEDAATVVEQPDPFLQVQTPVVGFQAGTESYDIALNVINGTKDINKVNVYSTFSNTEGESSNEVLLASYEVGDLRTVITDVLDYEKLKAGLTIGGSALPENQFDLAVGAGWALRFEGVRPDGETIPLGGTINVAVLSPYAGIYEYTHLEYYRIGVKRDDVTGPSIGGQVFIGSVDEDTFSHNDWWGPFSDWVGAHFEFDVDFENPISEGVYPVKNYQFPDGLYSGLTASTCETTPGDLPNAHCSESDRLIVDLETGKHYFILSYGYVSGGAAPGPREFYNEMEKVVAE